MSWHYSQALAAAYSAGNCSGGAPCAPLKSTDTPEAYSWPGKTTDALNPSQSGTTSQPSMADHGAELLTWFLAAFPARTSAQQERAPESPGREVGFGLTWPASSAKFDRASSSWKIHPCLFPEDLIECSVTLPKWGSMRNGELSERTMPARLTSGTGSGSWATPMAQMANGEPEAFLERKRRSVARGNKMGVSLTDLNMQVKAAARGMWPTPNVPNGGRSVKHVKDWRGKSAYHNGKKVQVGLEAAIKMFPTPRSEDSQCAGGHRGKDDTLYGMVCRPKEAKNWPTPNASDGTGGGERKEPNGQNHLRDAVKSAEVGGSLNPTWVCWLMGWPLGWTSMAPMAPETWAAWQRAFQTGPID